MLHARDNFLWMCIYTYARICALPSTRRPSQPAAAAAAAVGPPSAPRTAPACGCRLLVMAAHCVQCAVGRMQTSRATPTHVFLWTQPKRQPSIFVGVKYAGQGVEQFLPSSPLLHPSNSFARASPPPPPKNTTATSNIVCAEHPRFSKRRHRTTNSLPPSVNSLFRICTARHFDLAAAGSGSSGHDPPISLDLTPSLYRQCSLLHVSCAGSVPCLLHTPA